MAQERYDSEQVEVENKLRRFDNRESSLLARLEGVEIPERLLNWRFWIGDSVIYLNELRNLADDNR